MKAAIKYNSILSLLKHVGSLLLIYMICRVLFYVFNYTYFSDLSITSFIYILFAGFRFDLSVIVISNSLFLVLYLFPARFREKGGYRGFLKTIFIVVNSIAILANCVDFAYFKFTLKRTTADVLHFFDGKIGNDLGTLLPVFLKDYWYIFALWIVLTGVLVFLYKQIEKRRIHLAWSQVEFSREKNFFFLIIGLSILAYRGGIQLKPISAIDAGEYTSIKYVPLLTSTAFTIIKTLDVPAIQPVIYFTDQKELQQLYTTTKMPAGGPFQKKNVFILILESFSKEYVGALNGRHEGYTPFLDSLISESLTFTNAYANGKRSIEGIPAIVASIPSWMNEPYISSVYGSNQLNSLPNLLKSEGYYSAFFHGGTNGTMGFDAFAGLAGYDAYFGRKEYKNEQDYDGHWGIWDEEFLQYTAATMNKQQQPFLATVFTLSSHHPYSIPAKYAGKFKAGPLPIDISISYADYALSKFFKTAKKMPWFKNTLFVLVADHTSISEDPFYTNKVGNNTIPIIFYSGDHSLKAKDSTTVQQIDIMPSILDYLNYPAPYFSFGTSAFDSLADHFAFVMNEAEYEYITDDFSFGFNGKSGIDLYNIRNDSLLKTNLIKSDTSRAKKMELKTKAILQTYQQALINNRMNYKNTAK